MLIIKDKKSRMDKYEAEKILAELLGLTQIPQWATQDSDSISLVEEHGLNVTLNSTKVTVELSRPIKNPSSAKYSNHASKNAAVRYAILLAVINKLEMEKNEC